MIRYSRLLAAALLALALFTPIAPADAAQVAVCRGAAAGASPGPGRWTAPASGTSYTIDNIGCTRVNFADVADATAAGFTLRSQLFAAIVRLSAAGTLVLPAGVYIDRIVIQEDSGSSVTGGLKVGTTSGGTQVAAALICASSCLTWVADASISTRIFASTATQTLFIDAVSSWNSARVITTVIYGYY